MGELEVPRWMVKAHQARKQRQALVNKWQIFNKLLMVDFKNASKAIKTCMKLHNFCFNEKIIDADVTVAHGRVSRA
ncbi:hypothetical protein DVH05_018796 [Phytophthora capsici]|nr:hypothetical protein DVH05_018796 [Phytophthora capsici]